MNAAEHFGKIARSLRLTTKHKALQTASLLLRQTHTLHDAHHISEMVVHALHARFPHASDPERDVLAFYIIGKLAVKHAKAPSGRVSNVGGFFDWNLDAISEMSEMESLRLQETMDRYSKHMQAVSNITRTIQHTEDSIIQNIK